MGGQAEIPCPPSLLAFTNYFLFWGTWSWILDRGIDWGAGSRMHPLPSRLWPPQFSHENVSLLPTNCFYFTYFCLLVFLFSVFFLLFVHTQWCSLLAHGYALRNHSCWVLGTYMGCLRWNPVWPLAKQVPSFPALLSFLATNLLNLIKHFKSKKKKVHCPSTFWILYYIADNI